MVYGRREAYTKREAMDNEMEEQLRSLERALAQFAQASKRAVGFLATREYQGISFDIGRRFVIADLSPLSFFHLVEHIEGDDVEVAIHRLHDRLLPLLSCRHEWTDLKRSSDEHVRGLGKRWNDKVFGPYICKRCTAYALGRELPVVGRGVEH